VAISPDKRYVAFFTSDGNSDGVLTVWDMQQGETLLEKSIPAETSTSFRDAAPTRYLAWSPDGISLAVVMGRDLHSLDINQQSLKMLIPHREEQYAIAGTVMGSVKRPIWSVDGETIVFDAWSPPDVLSETADDIRDVHSVQVATQVTELLLENAQVAHRALGGEQELVLERQDGSLVVLDLTTLEIREADLSTVASYDMLCDPQGHKCASIVSQQAERDLLRLVAPDDGIEAGQVFVAELGETMSGCHFQSLLWDPEGDNLLVTIDCDERVSLWSIRVSDLEATHLVDWQDASSVFLLSWFE
jgi:WD40 repeat protein